MERLARAVCACVGDHGRSSLPSLIEVSLADCCLPPAKPSNVPALPATTPFRLGPLRTPLNARKSLAAMLRLTGAPRRWLRRPDRPARRATDRLTHGVPQLLNDSAAASTLARFGFMAIIPPGNKPYSTCRRRCALRLTPDIPVDTSPHTPRPRGVPLDRRPRVRCTAGHDSRPFSASARTPECSPGPGLAAPPRPRHPAAGGRTASLTWTLRMSGPSSSTARSGSPLSYSSMFAGSKFTFRFLHFNSSSVSRKRSAVSWPVSKAMVTSFAAANATGLAQGVEKRLALGVAWFRDETGVQRQVVKAEGAGALQRPGQTFEAFGPRGGVRRSRRSAGSSAASCSLRRESRAWHRSSGNRRREPLPAACRLRPRRHDADRHTRSAQTFKPSRSSKRRSSGTLFTCSDQLHTPIASGSMAMNTTSHALKKIRITGNTPRSPSTKREDT